MATGTANPNYESALVANTADTITLPTGWAEAQIINVDGTSRIDYTVDGSTPVVGGGTSSYSGRVLPAVAGYTDTINVKYNTAEVIKLISAGTPHYAIEVALLAEGE